MKHSTASIIAILATLSLLGCSDDNDKKTPTCTAQDQKCEHNMVYVCNNGAWSYETSCANGCDGNTCKTLDAPQCTDGQKKCENDKAYVCNNGAWDDGTPCEKGCDGDVCKTEKEEKCSDGQKKCENDKAFICTDGAWDDGTPCENGCDGDVCKTEDEEKCSDGLKKCENDKAFVCNDGAWDDGTPCEIGCDGDVCKENELRCTEPGESRCDNNEMQICIRGNWTTDEYCANGCDETNTKCKEPSPIDITKCEDMASSYCDGAYEVYCFGRLNNCRNDYGPEFTCAVKDGRTNCYEPCSEADVDKQKDVCKEYEPHIFESFSYICQKFDDGNYYWVFADGRECGGNCTEGKCQTIDPLEGTTCSEDDKDKCNGNVKLDCNDGIWRAVDCQYQEGDAYTCVMDEDSAFCDRPCSKDQKGSKICNLSPWSDYEKLLICEKSEDDDTYAWYDDQECIHGCKDGACIKIDEKEYTECNLEEDSDMCYGNLVFSCSDDVWKARVDCSQYESTAEYLITDYFHPLNPYASENFVCAVSEKLGYPSCFSECSEEEEGTTKTFCEKDEWASSGNFTTRTCKSNGNGAYYWDDKDEYCRHGCDENGCILYDEKESTECNPVTDTTYCKDNYRLYCGYGFDSKEHNIWYVDDCREMGSNYICASAYENDFNCYEPCQTPNEYKLTCDKNVLNYANIYQCIKAEDDKLIWRQINGSYCAEGCSDTEGCKGAEYEYCTEEGAKTCNDNETYTCHEGIWQYEMICLHGCDGDKCKVLDEKEFTECDPDTDTSFCKDNYHFYCDHDYLLGSKDGYIWYIDDCGEMGSNYVCASAYENDFSCFETCKTPNEYKLACDKDWADYANIYQCNNSIDDKLIWSKVRGIYCSEECSDTEGCKGAEEEYCTEEGAQTCMNDAVYSCHESEWQFERDCRHGCDGDTCKVLDEKEFTECDPESDHAYCKDTYIYQCSYDHYDDENDKEIYTWQIDDCSEMGQICYDYGDDYAYCGYKCESTQEDQTIYTCSTEPDYYGYYSSIENICQKSQKGIYYLNKIYQIECKHGCDSDNKCKMIDPLEGTECSDDDAPKCNNGIALMCDTWNGVWEAIECSKYDKYYNTCSIENNIALCKVDSSAPLPLNDINAAQSSDEYYCTNDFVEYCNGNISELCQIDSDDGSGYRVQLRCEKSCAIKIVDGKNKAVCTDDMTPCTKENETKKDCISDPEIEFQYICQKYSDGNLYWTQTKRTICSGSCDKGCTEVECDQEGQNKCNENALVRCEHDYINDKYYEMAYMCYSDEICLEDDGYVRCEYKKTSDDKE